MLGSFLDSLFISKGNCYLCRDSPDNMLKYICIDCFERLDLPLERSPRELENIHSIYTTSSYNGFIRYLIKEFKFQDKAYLYKPFGELLIKNIKENQLGEIDSIVAVPLYSLREAGRGYNQSDLLAGYISRKLKIPYSKDALIKLRNTRPQSSLNYLERASNLKSAFKARGDFKNKNILLIDDILTTGKTVEEVARTLREAGAKRIVVLTLTTVDH